MNRAERRAEASIARKQPKPSRRTEDSTPTETRMLGFVLVAIVLFYASIFLLVLNTPARAHSWYDPSCCSGKDCAPAAVGSVLATRDGWLVEVPPNGHPSVGPEGWRGLFPYDSPKLKESKDGQFHVCIGVYSKAAFCLYLPQGAEGV